MERKPAIETILMQAEKARQDLKSVMGLRHYVAGITIPHSAESESSTLYESLIRAESALDALVEDYQKTLKAKY